MMHRIGLLAAVAFLNITLSAPLAGQSALAEEQRTWTDSSGRHKIEGTLLRFDGEEVQLRLADGKVTVFPFSRLSQADQEYLQKNSKAEPPAEVVKPTDLQSACVAVWCNGNNNSYPAGGLVVSRQDGKAWVLAKSTSFTITSGPDVAYEVQAGEERLPATVVGKRFNHQTLYEVTDENLAVIPREDVAVEEGETITVCGYLISRSPPSANLTTKSGRINRVFKTLRGKTTSFRIELSEPPGEMAFVANSKGELIGIVGEAVFSRPGAEKETLPQYMVCPPSAFFAQVEEPLYEKITYEPDRSQSGVTKCQFSVYVSDPFDQIRKSSLLVRPGSERNFDNPKVLPTETPPLELKKQAEKVPLPISLGREMPGRYTVFQGEIDIPAPTVNRRDEVIAQFLWEDINGNAEYGPITHLHYTPPRNNVPRPDFPSLPRPNVPTP